MEAEGDERTRSSLIASLSRGHMGLENARGMRSSLCRHGSLGDLVFLLTIIIGVRVQAGVASALLTESLETKATLCTYRAMLFETLC